MPTFQLLPAIDLLRGRVVRLERGDFSVETAFSDDPVAVARAFVDGGATWLHVVDLDGARSGLPEHGEAIGRIVEAVAPLASVEIAGGLRTSGAVDAALRAGAARVVVGTTALADPTFAGSLVRQHGAERVAVALDVRGELAVGHGWTAGVSGTPVSLALARLLDEGVMWFEVTAIQRDGMLGGPDLELLEQVLRHPRAQVIAAGGIATVDHVRAVRSIGCVGAIVGRALYDGTLTLEAALAASVPDPLCAGERGGDRVV